MLDSKKLELVKISFSRLLKLEVPQFVNEVIDIVEKHDPELMKVDFTYNLLVAEKPQIKKLVVWYRSHPLTKSLSELRKSRTLYIGSVSSRMYVVDKEDVSGVNQSVLLVKSEISRFLENFSSSRNEAVKCQKVTQFFATIDQNEKLEDALTSLKFSEALDLLRSVHANILELRNERFSNISLRPKDKTTDLIDSVLSTTMILFKELEIAQLKFPEIDYEPLFNELNDRLIYYRDLINARALHNKKKAEMAKASGTEETEETTETTNSSQSAQPLEQRMFRLNAEDLNKNGNGNGSEVEKLDNEKTVVKSTKKPKLPPLNNED